MRLPNLGGSMYMYIHVYTCIYSNQNYFYKCPHISQMAHTSITNYPRSLHRYSDRLSVLDYIVEILLTASSTSTDVQSRPLCIYKLLITSCERASHAHAHN